MTYNPTGHTPPPYVLFFGDRRTSSAAAAAAVFSKAGLLVQPCMLPSLAGLAGAAAVFLVDPPAAVLSLVRPAAARAGVPLVVCPGDQPRQLSLF